MDEEYIKMCREAVEIQEAWQGKPGDAFYVPSRYEKGYGKLEAHISHLSEGVALFKTRSDIERLREEYQKLNYIWLPRQEDLQEILLKERNSDWLNLLFVWSVNTTPRTPYNEMIVMDNLNNRKYDSISKMWLAFTMEELYGKQWNGETWEKMR